MATRARIAARLLLAAMVLAVCSPSDDGNNGNSDGRTTARLNVLLIVTDDQREGMNVMPATMRWFADGGRSYPNAWVTTPLCCPARASIMTGRYAHNHGVKTNDFGAFTNLDQKTTIQHYLDEAGYRTAYLGKYLNKWPIERRPPHFDVNFSYSIGAPFYEGEWNQNGRVIEQRSGYWSYLIGDVADRFLQRNEKDDDRPWFLYINPPAPHIPALPETKYIDAPLPDWSGNPAVTDDLSDKAPFMQLGGVSPQEGREIRARQLRSLKSVDDLVDRVMQALERLDENDSTIAIFVSDNGFSWGEFGFPEKSLPYTHAVKIPMFVRGPGFEAGSADDRFVTHVDLAPTILGATGITPADDPPLDGHSLLDGGWERDRLLLEYWKTERYLPPDWQSLRTHGYQYVRYLAPGGGVTFEEYYDLQADPWQLDNLLADGDPSRPPPEELEAIRDRLDADAACRGDACP